ncbi:MAG: response regulator [Betaproteobacteria bacterium]|nr:MAG: response regulator [Betaproteobacteria bacterium]
MSAAGPPQGANYSPSGGSAATQPQAWQDHTSTARILVVDDTPHNVMLLCDLVEAQGYAAIAAESGREALAKIATDTPQLVLLDVVMPGMDGYAVCRAIRKDPKNAILPVVMVTALDPAEERIKGLGSGADDFLTKPINEAELLARVRSLLRIKSLYDTVEAQGRQLAEWNATLQQRVAEQVAHIGRLSQLKRFFSPQLAELIVAGGADDPLRSHRRDVTVVFIDLRGFTEFAEGVDPESLMGMLREFHEAMGRLIIDYQGTLERFTGDGMMIFFNDPVPISDPTERAIRMALAMQREFRKLCARWRNRRVELDLAIGIAEGPATIGAIGFEGRIDYGAIGPVTNLAARLCDQAQGGAILADADTLGRIAGRVDAEPLGRMSLKGMSKAIAVARIRGLR